MPMTLTDEFIGYAAQTDTGRVRRHNEDAVLCCSELKLWAVADGMGGHQCGEVASAIALETLREATASGADLVAAIHAANAAILAAAGQDSNRRGMGSAVVAVRFAGADFELAWIGDSRAYRVSADSIGQLTRDHSWVQAMVDAGEMSADEARSHPRRNVITHCLGRDEQALEVGLVQGTLGPGELLLLCSDGLTCELTDQQIQQLCATVSTLDGLVAQLIERANQLGGKDNISCIVLGRAVPEQPVAEARPRSFLSKLLNLRKQ
ncbi:serine/threonine-protein phosphatase [Pseudomonas cavernae]|uniref:Serine/threonine-protein phosphatase n=1 Tax=Pseudomonas cavernae TaxID=2320867 RepID=A0A385YZS5_9PSED|nr:protein phosphatase 2C domain-containing protein [Pseudomonas cavernae]AYC32276.1 serine/threonine-protein phosphatase [Pseudomonas cavernae]